MNEEVRSISDIASGLTLLVFYSQTITDLELSTPTIDLKVFPVVYDNVEYVRSIFDIASELN